MAACLRDGVGGSPTAVLTGDAPGDDPGVGEILAATGCSHAVVVGPPAREREVRVFTSAGELPSCGHGTVAVVAVLAAVDGAAFRGLLRIGGRAVAAAGVLRPGGMVDAWFDGGAVALRPAGREEVAGVLGALGVPEMDCAPAPVVADPGRRRLLLPVAGRDALDALRPDRDRLAAATHRAGLLGCFAYVPPPPGTARTAARMFAPAIGVDEDVCNANSAGCLAAHLLDRGRGAEVTVDQGDALGSPSTVHASARRTPTGLAMTLTGTARLLPDGG